MNLGGTICELGRPFEPGRRVAFWAEQEVPDHRG